MFKMFEYIMGLIALYQYIYARFGELILQGGFFQAHFVGRFFGQLIWYIMVVAIHALIKQLFVVFAAQRGAFS